MPPIHLPLRATNLAVSDSTPIAPKPVVKKEGAAKPHPYRAIGEAMAFTAAEALGYWHGALTGADVSDDDLKFNKKSWIAKLELRRGTVTFDTNFFKTNIRNHVFSGGSKFLIARENGEGVWWSLSMETGISTLWEYLVECLEKPSINDLWVTPIAGASVGESSFQLSAGLWKALFDRMHAPAHRFAVSVGVSQSLSNPAQGLGQQIDAEGSVVNLPGFGEPGRLDRNFSNGGVAAMTFSDTRRGLADDAYRFTTDALLAGHVWQNLSAGRNGLVGTTLIVGGGMGYDYGLFNDRANLPLDKIGVVKAPEAVADLDIHFANGLEIHPKLSISADFALVTPAALTAWQATHSLASSQQVLRDQGYDYSKGLTLHPEIAIAYNGLQLSGAYEWDRYRTILGHDRDRTITNELTIDDSRSTATAQLSYELGPMTLNTALTQRKSWGQIGTVEAETKNTTLSLNLGLHL